jgi:hypothetical protein
MFPSLDKEGKPRPQATTGVVRRGMEKPNQWQDKGNSHHPRGAARRIPSSAEEGSSSEPPVFAARN